MTIEEAIKMMEREKTRACFDCMHPQAVGYCEEVCRLPEAFNMAIQALETVQEHKDTFEWCVECKEYDQEQHCCHRWTKQIRKTIKEWESENSIVRCGQCKYMGDDGRCSEFADDNIRPSVSDFCSYGERRE